MAWTGGNNSIEFGHTGCGIRLRWHRRLSQKHANWRQGNQCCCRCGWSRHVGAKDERRIVAIRPKPPFIPVFLTASTTEESWMELTHEPPGVAPEARADSCSWWRRGGVEPPVQKTPRWNVLQAYPALYFSPFHRSAGEIVIRPADSSLAATIGVRAGRTPITWRLFPVLGARRGQT